MKTSIRNFMREWWPLAALFLGSSWIYAPFLNKNLNSTTTLISMYESPGQRFDWLFRLCDILAALLLGFVITKLVQKKRVDRRIAVLMFIFVAGSLLDGILTIECPPVRAGMCEVRLSAMTILHGMESVITSFSLFLASVLHYRKTRRSNTLLFIIFQMLYAGVLVVTLLTHTVGHRTLSQFGFQMISLLWLVGVLRNYAGITTGARPIRQLVAWLVSLNGVVAISLSVISLPFFNVFRGLYFADPTTWFAQHTIIAGLLLLYIGRHIYRGEANARIIALVILGGETLKYSIITPEIILLAVYSISFMLVFISGAYFDRHSVAVRLQKRFIENIQSALIALAVFAASIAGVGYLDHINKLPKPIDKTFDSVGGIRKHGRKIMNDKYVKRLANVALGGALGLALFSFFRPRSSHSVADDSDRQLARELLEKYSSSSEDYFKIWPEDKLYFWNNSRTGFIAYKISGSVAFALADPIAADNRQKNTLIDNFTSYCRRHGWRAAFLMVGEKDIKRYESKDYRLLQIGSSAVIDVSVFARETCRDKWWRWQINRSSKSGLSHHVSSPPHSAEVLANCASVSRSWLNRPGRKEQGFALGYYNESYLQKSEIHYLMDESGRVVAFTNMLPIFSGERTTIDLMRFLPDIDGAMPYLLSQTILYIAEQGQFNEFDLGFVPLAETDTAIARLAKSLAGKRFAASGLAQFKNKFDPKWENMYLAADGDVADLAVIALNIERLMSV